MCGLLPLTNDIAPHSTLHVVLPLLAVGYFVIAPYGTLWAVLPLLGGGDTVGRRATPLGGGGAVERQRRGELGDGSAVNRAESWLGGIASRDPV